MLLCVGSGEDLMNATAALNRRPVDGLETAQWHLFGGRVYLLQFW